MAQEVQEGVTGWGWRRVTDPLPSGGAPSLLPPLKLDGGSLKFCTGATLRSMLPPSDPRYVAPEYNMQCVMAVSGNRKASSELRRVSLGPGRRRCWPRPTPALDAHPPPTHPTPPP